MNESPDGARQAADARPQPPGDAWSEADEAYLAAANLAAWLRSGQGLLPIQSLIALQPEEKVFYNVGFTGYVFSTAAVRYSRGWVAAFGSPAWLAASLGASAAYNSYQRSRAQAEATAQRRLVDHGTVHITSRRICLQGRLQWTDIPLADVRALDALPDGVVIHRMGQSPIKIATHAVAYLYVLLFFLVHRQGVDVPLPDDFAERARNAGRTVPAGSPTLGATTSPAALPAFATGPAPHNAGTTDVLSGWNSPATENTKTDVLGRPFADWGTRAVALLIDTLLMLGGWAVFIVLIWFGANQHTPPDQYGNTSITGTATAIVVISVIGMVAWTVAYHMLCGRESGQTPGRRLVAIQVRDAVTGGPIGYPRAFGRYLAYAFAWLILPIVGIIDLLWPLWDDRMQTLHDKAVNSVVVKLESHK